jgi:type VI protein secretion system component Hcp
MRTFVVGLSIMGVVTLSMAPLAHAGSKGSGKVKVQDISVTKYQDVSSPRLMQKSKTGVFKRTPDKVEGHSENIRR